MSDLEAIVRNIIKVGVVESFNEANATARVIFEDIKVKSYDLPIIVKQSQNNKDYWIPDIGESVLCLFLPTGIESGFILGSYYNKKDRPPVTDQNKRTVKFSDGTILEYDRKTHKLTADVKGDIDIKATGKVDMIVNGDISLQSGANIILTANRIDFNEGV